MNMLTFYLAIILFDFVFEAQNYSFYSIPQNVFRIILDNKFVLGSVPSATLIIIYRRDDRSISQ